MVWILATAHPTPLSQHCSQMLITVTAKVTPSSQPPESSHIQSLFLWKLLFTAFIVSAGTGWVEAAQLVS